MEADPILAQVTGPRPPAAGVTARERNLGRIARGGFFNLLGAGMSAVSTFAFTVVVTRGIDRSEAGIFFALTSAFVIAFSFARLGIPTGLVYFIARHRAAGEQQRLRSVVGQAVLIVTVVATLLGVAGVAAAPWLAEKLTGSADPETVALVRLLSCGIGIAALNDVAVGTTRGFGVMRPLVVVDRVGRPILQLLLAGAVVAAGGVSALSIGVAWLVPYLPAAVVLLWWGHRLRRGAERRASHLATRTSLRSEVGPFWRFTAPRSVGSIAQMVLQRADIVLIGIIRGPGEAAIYAAATRFLVFGQLGANAIGTTIQPKLAALLSQGRTAEARTVYRVATVWLLLITWPAYLTFAVLAPELLLIFGTEYAIGWPVIVVLSVTMLVATACGAVDVVLTMAGRSTWTMVNSLVALAVNIGLNLLLIPPLGFVGAALAWSAAILLNNLLPLSQLAYALRLHPFGRSSACAALLAMCSFGVLPLAARATSGDTPVPVIAATAVGAAFYAVGLWRGRRLFDLGSFAAIRRRAG